MEKGGRSGDLSGYVVKHKNSSGCLIVRKKGAVHGGGGSNSSDLKKKKKRPRLELSDSSSSDELLNQSRKRVGTRVGTLEKASVENSEIGRKRSAEDDTWNGEGGEVGEVGEKGSEGKNSKLDVFEFDEYGGIDDVMTVKKYFDLYGSRPSLSSLKGKRESDKPIRIQGKNGVLKIMVNKKKKVGGSFNGCDGSEDKEYGKGLRIPGSAAGRDAFHSPINSEPKIIEKGSSSFKTGKKPKNVMRSSVKNEMFDDDVSDESNLSSKVGLKNLESHRSLQTEFSTKNGNDHGKNPEDSKTLLEFGSNTVKACKSLKNETSGRIEKNSGKQVLTKETEKGKVKRCTGTEKQRLRERIKEMLLSAGWTIDYRPRKNRDYLDAVYISPSGTGYWSIIKAYEALQKQLTNEEDEAKLRPLSDEVLSQLTRKTRKTIEKQMKKKQTNDSESEDEREFTGDKISTIRDDDSANSNSDEEKLCSFIKLGTKSSKSRTNNNCNGSASLKDQSLSAHAQENIEKPSALSNSRNGDKSRKLGRCTLVVRNSTEGLDSDNDGFVPYSGKRTLLSWLIDCGTVQLRQKVRYMNRRRSKVMLEGWLTRDGIHCGCCSKILTVSKFEIHAGSKLHQPFQNICLDSGKSLLECQIDAWKRQESVGQIGFHSVDVNCDDPNDDTCGLCGDGGDLICCDGCPSTFHLSCLDIEMLPPGDWHCQNCTCKFCGLAREKTVQGYDDTTVSTLLVCSSCGKSYHKSCMPEMKDLSIEANSSELHFCEKKCKELFEQLQKLLGIKHELGGGFSWSLIHRTDIDSDASIEGFTQKIECNSKLAVALSIMDECFLPIVDRRSGINIIHNVLYNCGSNFSRLNYCGFYIAILERGDEILAAASIRLHGTRLAEMPFIGTRPMYRRQGMCRRLFDAVESALSSLKVEKLIIPAVSDLMHTWTEVFGFTTLQKSLKQELKSMNVLVFPGIDLLQKQLSEKKIMDLKITTISGKLKEELDGNKCSELKVTTTCEVDSSSGKEAACDNDGLKDARGTNELVSVNSGCPSPGDCLQDNSMMRSSSDSSHELKNPVSPGDTVNLNPDSSGKFDESALLGDDMNMNPDSEEKVDESALAKKNEFVSGGCDNVSEVGNGKDKKSTVDQSSQQGIQDSSNVMDTDLQCLVSLDETSTMRDSLETSSNLKDVLPNGTADVVPQSESKALESVDISGSRGEDNVATVASSIRYCKESLNDDCRAGHLNESASDELSRSIAIPQSECPDIQSDDKSVELASSSADQSQGVTEVETKAPTDTSVEDGYRVSKEGDLGVEQMTDVEASITVVIPSMEKSTGENCAKKIDDDPGISVSSVYVDTKYDPGSEDSSEAK